MASSLKQDYAAGLLEGREPPCLSLYQPTHRHHPQNQQDPIRFRNLVKALEESLLQKYPTKDVQPLLKPFLAVAEDRDFWNHTRDGLAVLGAKGMFRIYKLQRPIGELAIAADDFHIKPLIRILQSADRYHLLGVTRKEIKLFEGNRDALDEIELPPGFPRTMTDALGAELTEPHQTVSSYGGLGQGHSPMHHGHGGKESEVDMDAERFFRAVDRAILEHYSRPSTLPLMLATLPEHRPIFRQVSHNPYLMDEGLDIHPDALPLDELRKRAWQVIEPRYLARLAALVEEFNGAKAKGLAHDELGDVAKAAVAGRVATLLIEADRVVPGRIDTATGDIELGDLARPDVDDLLDDLGTLALKMGGQVVIVPAQRMPTGTGMAAIYRY
jgi:hypothetical protein